MMCEVCAITHKPLYVVVTPARRYERPVCRPCGLNLIEHTLSDGRLVRVSA